MKFVVCGGGTAGWVTALTIHSSNPTAHEVVVIESQKIGIIGAGEATSGLMYDLLDGSTLFNNTQTLNPNRTAFDFVDFAKKVDAVPKYALKHINWAKEKGHYWAPINGSETSRKSPDHIFRVLL
jgi:tryptophan halogenase